MTMLTQSDFARSAAGRPFVPDAYLIDFVNLMSASDSATKIKAVYSVWSADGRGPFGVAVRRRRSKDKSK